MKKIFHLLQLPLKNRKMTKKNSNLFDIFLILTVSYIFQDVNYIQFTLC